MALELHTRRLTLSPLTEVDAPALLAYRGDPEVCRFQHFEPRTLGDAAAFIAAAASAGANDWHQLGVRLRPAGDLVGDVGFRVEQDDATTAEVGVTIAPPHQREGLASETVRVLLGHLFGKLGLQRVVASVDPGNDASLALFERLGFTREAQLRESVWFKGEWADDVVFALTRSEWEERPAC